MDSENSGRKTSKWLSEDLREDYDKLEEEREKRRKRAARFGTDYKEPSKRQLLGVTAARRISALETPSGPARSARSDIGVSTAGFITGLDVTTEEERKKAEQRAKRFDTNYRSWEANSSADTSMEKPEVQNKRRIWAGSELRDADKKYREEMKEAEEKGMAKEEFYRANVLHLFAPLYLGASGRDIREYFMDFGASWIEWLNGKSVNVIFEDPATAKRALLHVGRPVPLEEVRLQDEASKGEEDAENAEAKQPESESGQTDASAMAGSEHQSASLESPAEETNSTEAVPPVEFDLDEDLQEVLKGVEEQEKAEEYQVHDDWRVCYKPLKKTKTDKYGPAGMLTRFYLRPATVFDSKERATRTMGPRSFAKVTQWTSSNATVNLAPSQALNPEQRMRSQVLRSGKYRAKQRRDTGTAPRQAQRAQWSWGDGDESDSKRGGQGDEKAQSEEQPASEAGEGVKGRGAARREGMFGFREGVDDEDFEEI